MTLPKKLQAMLGVKEEDILGFYKKSEKISVVYRKLFIELSPDNRQGV